MKRTRSPTITCWKSSGCKYGFHQISHLRAAYWSHSRTQWAAVSHAPWQWLQYIGYLQPSFDQIFYSGLSGNSHSKDHWEVVLGESPYTYTYNPDNVTHHQLLSIDQVWRRSTALTWSRWGCRRLADNIWLLAHANNNNLYLSVGSNKHVPADVVGPLLTLKWPCHAAALAVFYAVTSS